MKYNDFKSDIEYYVRTVVADIEELEKIGDKVAKEEFDWFQEHGYACPSPTTNPLGNAYSTSQFVPSRCTVPMCMMCFSVIDFVGKIIAITSEGSENDYEINGFAKHAQLFFRELANSDDLKSEKTSSKLQDVYRHSIMHTFLPRPSYNIGYSVAYSRVINEYTLFDKSFDDKEILNVKYIVLIVKRGLTALINKIKEENHFSKNVHSNYERYLAESDENERVQKG